MIFPTEQEVEQVTTYAETRDEVLRWYIKYFCYLNHLTH